MSFAMTRSYPLSNTPSSTLTLCMTADASAITYEMATTTVMHGLPKNQRDDVLQKIRQRYYDSGFAEAPIRLSQKLEIQARAKCSYDVASTYFKNEHNAAIRRAEQYEDSSLFDSDDEEHEGPPADIVVWNATTPTPPGVAAVRGEGRTRGCPGHGGRQRGSSSAVSTRRPGKTRKRFPGRGKYFSSGIASAADLHLSAPPRHFMNFAPASQVNAENIEHEWSVFPTREEYRAARDAAATAETPADAATAAAEDGAPVAAPGDNEPPPTPVSESSEAPSRHDLRIISLYGFRDVDCGCTNGKHDEHRRRQSFAFEASDGTVVVKTMRTQLLSL
ncbi:hypothetical protein R3P38DRAFT_3187018 [Favolaschia claudopus]|uniref:Uncharacterized protein n=1 Tax=Favolaschia claudopus TaxID=2862362 RepID=A0AAW0C0M0_9AGAR